MNEMLSVERMDPFELTKDPDGGGITVRVKSGFVVLTREEEKRISERMMEILADNEKLREENEKLRYLVAEMFKCVKDGNDCERCRESNDGYACAYVMRDLGIEVEA